MNANPLIAVVIHRIIVTAALLAATFANAQDAYPARPIRLLVGFAAGGPADGLARIVGQSLTESLGQPVVVENKPGAGGTIAAAQTAKAAPDGYNLMLISSGHAGNGAYYNGLTYHTVKSFAPVGGVASSPVAIIVNANSPYRTLADLLAQAKKAPGSLNFGTGGGATLTNLAAELLKAEAGLDAKAIAYKGSGPALTALLGGEIDAVFDTVSSSVSLVRSGKLRAIAVTSANRSSVLPEVQTVAEQGVSKFDATGWFAVVAPASTPPQIVARLNADLNKALSSPPVKERLAGFGADSMEGSSAQFGNLLEKETVRWSALIRRLGLKAE